MDTASTILISLVALYMIIKLFGLLSRWGIKQIRPQENSIKKRGFVLLDVRTDKEYAQGHIPAPSMFSSRTDIG